MSSSTPEGGISAEITTPPPRIDVGSTVVFRSEPKERCRLVEFGDSRRARGSDSIATAGSAIAMCSAKTQATMRAASRPVKSRDEVEKNISLLRN